MRTRILPFIFFVSIGLFAQTPAPLSASVKTYVPSCNLGAAKVTATGGIPPYFYQWSTGAIGDTVSSFNAGSYSVKVSDSSTSITVNFTIELVCQVDIANKFSPNGDGINDTWAISKWENYPNFLLQVFDRWGQVVHEQRKLYIPWDGTHFGIKLPDATYYAVFFYDEKTLSKHEKASVTILR